MSDPVIVEVTIAAPVSAVWRALREPDQIRHWHGWDYDGIDAEITAIYVDDVTESEQDHTLDVGEGRFELEPRGESTVVRLTRAAPAGTSSWDGIYDEINEGWLSFVQHLRYYLERHPGEPRRTMFLETTVPLPAGEPWFRSEHQTGVLLDGYGLLIVGSGSTIVSTYGLDDEEFSRLAQRLAPAS